MKCTRIDGRLISILSLALAVLLLGTPLVMADPVTPAVTGADAAVTISDVLDAPITDGQPWQPIKVEATLTIDDTFPYAFPILVRADVGLALPGEYVTYWKYITKPGTYVGTYFVLPKPNWVGATGAFGAAIRFWYDDGGSSAYATATYVSTSSLSIVAAP